MVIFPAWATCAFKILILLVTYVWIITCDELHAHEQDLFFSVFLACEQALLFGQAKGCLLLLVALSDFSSLPQRDSLLID